jgi:uncharacterized protein (DUF362 family)
MADALWSDAVCGSTPQTSTSRIVLVRDSRVIDSSGVVQHPLLQEMLDRALLAYSRKSTIGDAWKEFVRPQDTVGLKLNGNSVPQLRGSELVSHFPAVTSAILAGFREAGIPEENVVLWDRSDEEVAAMGHALQKDSGAMRALGTRVSRRGGGGPGFSSESFQVGSSTSKVSAIASEMCTALINLPVLKDHSTTGITGALKNHYGSIDNPNRYHRNRGTNPGIAEVNAIPVIREKERLIVFDALLGVFNGGPRWQRQFIWPYGGILVGTDPVAMDQIALTIIDEKRRQEGLEPLAREVPSLEAAEALGLGTRDLEQVELEEITLG